MASSVRIALYGVIFGLVIYYVKQYMNGSVCSSTSRLDGKVAIITGANRGIGKANTLDFVQRGARVIMACRSRERAEAAKKEIISSTGAADEQLVIMQLDLSSVKSIRNFAQEFETRERRLDILVNNAGLLWTPHSTTEDGFEMQFGVNHLGHFLLTSLLAEMLIQSSPSRVIIVSSTGHEMGTMNFHDLMPSGENYNGFRAYTQSKLANVLFTTELARRLKGSGVNVYAVHPGIVMTDMLYTSTHFKFLSTTVKPVDYVSFTGEKQHVLEYLFWPIVKDSWHGAQTQICCAVDESLADEQFSGKYFSDTKVTVPSAAASSEEDARRLWDVSVDLLKLDKTEMHPLFR